MSSVQIPQDVRKVENWIAGRFEPGSGPELAVISPYTGTKVGVLHVSTAADVDRAVRAAAQAAPGWGRTPLKERCGVLFRFREVLLRDLDRISQTISLESGKTLAEAKAGLLKGVEVLEFALSLQNLDAGGRMEVSRGVFCEYRREALGVVAGITPFNFPAMVPMWMMPIAIGVGNAFVWKPSDKTPMTPALIAQAWKEAGLPDGVLTVVHGGRETVEAVLDHPEIRAVGFVGSTPVARSVYERGSRSGKRVLALGGAKNPIILMPDADVEMASRGIADSFTGCAGQRCMAASLLIVVGDGEKILDQVVEKAKAIRLGPDMGALISRESRERLVKGIEKALQEGATLRLDGRLAVAPAEYAGGNWLGPTILDHVKPGSSAACDELFGPLISVVRVNTLSEALEIEAALPFGNAASVFTSNGAVAERVAQEARAGMIGVNIGVPVPREPFSFGGFYDSKFGSGDITGASGVEFWSDRKKITVKWSAASDKNWMN